MFYFKMCIDVEQSKGVICYTGMDRKLNVDASMSLNFVNT